MNLTEAVYFFPNFKLFSGLIPTILSDLSLDITFFRKGISI